MTAKEYLQLLRSDLTKRERMEECIDQLLSRAYPGSMNIKQDLVQESAPSVRLLEVMAEADEKISKYRKELKLMRYRRSQAYAWISQIDNELHRRFLIQYYLTPVTAEEKISNVTRTWNVPQTLDMAASAIGRSHIWAKTNHRQAIHAFAHVSGLPDDINRE